MYLTERECVPALWIGVDTEGVSQSVGFRWGKIELLWQVRWVCNARYRPRERPDTRD
jgi:hypothetical protein